MSEITTVCVKDNKFVYEDTINQLLKKGWKILSTHCSATSGPVEYSWMAILIKEKS